MPRLVDHIIIAFYVRTSHAGRILVPAVNKTPRDESCVWRAHSQALLFPDSLINSGHFLKSDICASMLILGEAVDSF